MTFQRLGFLGRSILTVSASIMAITNPTRADLVATVGELTGVEALRKLRDRLSRTPQGREILKQRPRIEQTICREKLAQLEPNTFGYRYEMFLARHQFSPLERPIVRFIQDEELAYIMQVSIIKHTDRKFVCECVDTYFYGSVIAKFMTFGTCC